jgi:hypothetical protein
MKYLHQKTGVEKNEHTLLASQTQISCSSFLNERKKQRKPKYAEAQWEKVTKRWV